MRWRMLSCETLLVAAGACSDESDDSSVVLLVQINKYNWHRIRDFSASPLSAMYAGTPII
jgi:hypothetical protein